LPQINKQALIKDMRKPTATDTVAPAVDQPAANDNMAPATG